MKWNRHFQTLCSLSETAWWHWLSPSLYSSQSSRYCNCSRTPIWPWPGKCSGEAGIVHETWMLIERNHFKFICVAPFIGENSFQEKEENVWWSHRFEVLLLVLVNTGNWNDMNTVWVMHQCVRLHFKPGLFLHFDWGTQRLAYSCEDFTNEAEP